MTSLYHNPTGTPDDPFDTYYLVQKSRTGYVFVTWRATRYRDEAMAHLDDVVDDFHHARVINAKTKKVLAIRRPGMKD